MIVCNICGVAKQNEFLTADNNSALGVRAVCKKCHREREALRRRTPDGIFSPIYNRQKRRSKTRGMLPPAYSLKQLKEKYIDDPEFKRLFAQWESKEYDVRYTPSFDRIDDYKGYSFDNIRIVTWEQNNKRHHSDRKEGINNKANKAVLQYSLDGVLLGEYYSVNKAGRENSVWGASISKCCRGQRVEAGGFKWKFKEQGV